MGLSPSKCALEKGRLLIRCPCLQGQFSLNNKRCLVPNQALLPSLCMQQPTNWISEIEKGDAQGLPIHPPWDLFPAVTSCPPALASASLKVSAASMVHDEMSSVSQGCSVRRTEMNNAIKCV
eukprot:1142069-Pelagomonas_calceolata.AAC.4